MRFLRATRPESKRKYEPAAGGTAALDAAGAAREPPPVTRHSSAAEVVLGYVCDQVAAIFRYEPLVRRDEPDAVHQMRVATTAGPATRCRPSAASSGTRPGRCAQN